MAIMTAQPESSDSKPSTWTPALLGTAFLLFLAYLLRYVLLPFIVAGGIAFISAPLVRWLMKKWRLPHWAAALAPFVLLLVLLGLLAWGIEAFAVPEVTSLLKNMGPILDQAVSKMLGNKTIDINGKTLTAHTIALTIQQNLANAVNPANAIRDATMAFAGVMGLILTIVLLIYFLLDAPRIAQGLIWVVPPRIRPHARAVGHRAGPVIFSYTRGIVIIVSYATVLTFLVARFLLHVPDSVILAIAVGLLEMIPVIGPVIAIALIITSAVARITFWGMVGSAIFAAALRISIDQFIGPLVLGRFVKVSPPLIIFAFLAGGTIWGIMGVVVAVPVAAIIKIILEEAYKEQEITWAGA